VFVLDVSTSINNDANFGLIREFVIRTSSLLPVGINHTLFSVILFARHAWINFTIPDHTNRADFIDAVNEISYYEVSKLNRTGTNIPEALDLLRIAGKDSRLGLRPDAIYTSAIVITDSRPNTVNLVQTQLGEVFSEDKIKRQLERDERNSISAAKRLHRSGIFDDVYAVGIRGVHDIEELAHIASHPELEIKIDHFTEESFQEALDQLSEQFCDGNLKVIYIRSCLD